MKSARNVSEGRRGPARGWVRGHNRQIKRGGDGVRVIASYLPIKSPWHIAIKTTRVHGKRRVVDAERELIINALVDRVSDAYGGPHEPHLISPDKAA